MKKSLTKNLFVLTCILLLSGLPWGCSEINRVVADHPCCVAEKKAYDDAEKAFQKAVAAEQPSLFALLNGQLELIRLENIVRRCEASATNPTFECKDQRAAANSQQTRVNDLIRANKPFKDATEFADQQRLKAGKALDDCAARNHCTP